MRAAIVLGFLVCASMANLDVLPWCMTENCKICFPRRDTCNKCEPGHWLDESSTCKECRDSNCRVCGEGGSECESCETGYFLGSNGKCKECHKAHDNCVECSQDGEKCYTCETYHQLRGNECQYTPNQECSLFEFDQSGACVRCSEAIFNCQTCSIDGQWCYSCMFNDVLVGNQCFNNNNDPI